MNKFISLLVSIFALTCVTLVDAQQSENQGANSNQENPFLKAYGSHSQATTETQPTENEDGSQNQSLQTQQSDLANEQPAATIQNKPKPFAPPKSIWDRLKVPPRDTNQNTQQTETETSNQLQTKEQTQNTPSHYNIFQ